MPPYLTDYPRYAWQVVNGSRSTGELDMARRRSHDLAPYLDMRCPLRILDVANGRLRPQYTILKAKGHQVYGIDWVNRPAITKTDHAYRLARWIYSWKLGVPSERRAEQTLACGDVGKLPFPDFCFDLAVSAAAFEHFLDVPTVIAELHRVLRAGGLVWVSIHLFTCPSGGHNVSFSESPIRNVPSRVELWDHLRQRSLPFTVPLNEWRRDQYLAAFARHFEVLMHYCAVREGEHLLTKKLEAELSAYDRDELTSGTYVIVARKQ